MRNILVTSAGTRVAYAICKSLARKGLRVYAGDSAALPMTAFSRHCAGAFRHASPFTDQERFWNDLTAFLRRKQIDVLIPVLEETYCLARTPERLPASVHTLLPRYAHVLAVHDKARLHDLARSLGIPVPQTRELSDVMGEPARHLNDVPFPALLKPRQGGGGWAMRRIVDAASLESALAERGFPAERFVLQQEIAGDVVCVCAIYKDGRRIAADAYKTLRSYPHPYGQATLRISLPGGAALDHLTALLDHLHWNGVCEADFIQDNAGRFFLLDVNPRFWGSLAQNIAAGVDYPDYYRRLAEGERNFATGQSIPGVRTRWLGGDLMRLATAFTRGPNRLGLLRHGLSNSEKTRECDDWSLSDPLPFLAWAVRQCGNKLLGKQPDALPGVWC